jgi:phosphohistidine phosphatase
LFVLRHGEAGKSIPDLGKDTRRHLTVSGRQKIEKIAYGLKDSEINFDIIITSPINRARETADVVAEILKIKDRVENNDNLKPEGNRLELYRKISGSRQNASVLIVGHEPYLSSLIGDIIAANPNSHIALKKGGMAKIAITSFSPRISGELRWLLTPRQLRKLG